MSYHRDRWQGAGAIAAAAPAPRSAPAPTIQPRQPRMPRLGGMPGPLGALASRLTTSTAMVPSTMLAPRTQQLGTFVQQIPPTMSYALQTTRAARPVMGVAFHANLLSGTQGQNPVVVVPSSSGPGGSPYLGNVPTIGGGFHPKLPPVVTHQPRPYALPQYGAQQIAPQPPPVIVGTPAGSGGSSATSPTTVDIGSGGSGISPTVDMLPIEEQLVPISPSAPVLPAPTTAPNRTKLYLAIGGGALLLYWLFKKKPQP